MRMFPEFTVWKYESKILYISDNEEKYFNYFLNYIFFEIFTIFNSILQDVKLIK